MTSTMSRWVLTGALALGALAAIGGFAPVVATAVADPSASPFEGSWSGTWSVPDRGVIGTYDWTISESGRIDGTVYNSGLDNGGGVVGHVGDDGKIHFVGYAPNAEHGAGFSGFGFQGTAEIDEDGKLVISAVGLGENPATRPALDAVLERN